jgi:hypothetical protein
MRVLVPSPLFSYTGGRREVEGTGATLREVVESLDRQFPGIAFRIVDENGAIREHIRFWIGTTVAKDLRASVGPSDAVMIVASLSGG